MDRRRLLSIPLVAALSSRAASENHELALGGATIAIETDTTVEPEFGSLVIRWVEKSAEAVIRYYGKFPVSRLRLRLRLASGRGVRGGKTFSGDPPTIRVNVGLGSGEDDLLHGDWVMVHEMIHLAFPWLNGAHNWMAEGIAVYVESIARVQAGHLPAEQIWGDFIRMMPRGLPQAGDGGLDVTRSWGRTYWGGALFCLEADLRIRQQTDNRVGLQHALRAINATRNFSRAWPFRETLEIGDRSTGTTVIVDLYDAWRETAVTPDLDALWRDLGIEMDERVVFNDAAPLAAMRIAITRAA